MSTSTQTETLRILRAVRDCRLYRSGGEWAVLGETAPAPAPALLARLQERGYLRPLQKTVGYNLTDFGARALSEVEPHSQVGIHRVTVNFSDAAYRVLEDLAERKRTTIGEVLRDSLALYKWFVGVEDSGGRVLVEREGLAREVMLR